MASVKRLVAPRSYRQQLYIQSMIDHDIVISIGPAGTGKTYLAVAMAAAALLEKRVRRIILARPAVEAGEKLGFLPGDLVEKVNPYLRPLHDALHDIIGFEKVSRMMERGIIEIAPIAFMRGRTLNDSFIILDEAQNTTPEQMKMFLTRIGFNSKAVINGDVTQVDLPQGRMSGLREAQEVLSGVEGIKFFYFDQKDVVRHVLVQKIVTAYDAFEKRKSDREAEERAARKAAAQSAVSSAREITWGVPQGATDPSHGSRQRPFDRHRDPARHQRDRFHPSAQTAPPARPLGARDRDADALARGVPDPRHLVPGAGRLPVHQARSARHHRRPRLRGLARPAAQRRRGDAPQAGRGPQRRAAGLRLRSGGGVRVRGAAGPALRSGAAPARAASGGEGWGAGGGPRGGRPCADGSSAAAERRQDHAGAGGVAGAQGVLVRPRGAPARRPDPGAAPRRGGQQGPAAGEPPSWRHPAQPRQRLRAPALRPLRPHRLSRRGARPVRDRGAELGRLQAGGAPAAGRPAARERAAEPVAEP